MRNMKGAAHHIVRLFLMMGFFLTIPSSSKAQDSFQIPSWLQEKLGLTSYKNFLLFENTQSNSQYSVVSNFEGNVIESQPLIGTQDLDSAQKFIDEHLKIHQGGSIRELELPLADGSSTSLFWVAHQSYPNLEQARQAAEKASSEGVVFANAPSEEVEVTPEVQVTPESEPPSPVPSSETKPAYPLHLDEKIQQVAIPGTELKNEKDRFYTQIFGEYSWRRTNFDAPNTNTNPDYFNDIVGFLTCRFGMKAFQFYEGGPYLQPVLGIVPSISTSATPFDNKIELFGGLAYYPFEETDFLKTNPFLEWIRDIHFQALYLNLFYLRKESTEPTYDWLVGPFLWKRWGWNKPFDEQPREKFYHYLWGEVFSDIVWRKTSYTDEDFESMQYEFAGWLGVKFPWVDPIPPLMPYIKLEATASQHDDFFRNRVSIFYGVRYMPFYKKKFGNYEFLNTIQLFAEYGEVESYFKDDPPDDQPDWDFRVGIKIDVNRF